MARRSLVIGTVSCCLVLVSAHAGTINWRTDLPAALAEASGNGRLLMISVCSGRSEECNRLENDTFSNEEVQVRAAGFVPVRLDPQRQELTAKYRVRDYPVILFIEADGTLVSRKSGFLDAPALLAFISVTQENGPKTKTYLAELESGDKSHSQELLSMLVEMERTQDAIHVFDEAADSLEPSFGARIALSMAQSLVGEGGYYDSLRFLKTAETLGKGSPTALDAFLLHAVALFHARGKQAGIDFLSSRMGDPSVPRGWKTQLESVMKEMLKWRDPGY
jgi:thioredoxin-related protein